MMQTFLFLSWIVLINFLPKLHLLKGLQPSLAVLVRIEKDFKTFVNLSISSNSLMQKTRIYNFSIQTLNMCMIYK